MKPWETPSILCTASCTKSVMSSHSQLWWSGVLHDGARSDGTLRRPFWQAWSPPFIPAPPPSQQTQGGVGTWSIPGSRCLAQPPGSGMPLFPSCAGLSTILLQFSHSVIMITLFPPVVTFWRREGLAFCVVHTCAHACRLILFCQKVVHVQDFDQNGVFLPPGLEPSPSRILMIVFL